MCPRDVLSLFCFNDTATTEIYTYYTLFPYTTLVRSRLPIAVELQAHGTVKSFALGLSCELPVLVVRDSEAVFFAPGQELRVSIENKRDDQQIGRAHV